MDLSIVKLDIKHLSKGFVNEKLKGSEAVLKSPFTIPMCLSETFTHAAEGSVAESSFFEVNTINTHFHL